MSGAGPIARAPRLAGRIAIVMGGGQTPGETIGNGRATAVLFARQVTGAPARLSDAEWAGLVKEFGDRGALEVLLQTCTFAFMNRFTDGLMLPSEDEAIKAYQETYGSSPGPLRAVSPE